MSPRIRRSCSAVLAGALAALLLAACGRPETLPIEMTRDLPKPRGMVPPNAPDWHRLGLRRQRPKESADRPRLAWDLPPGWKHVPTPRRPFNFAIEGDPQSDVYLTALARQSGTLLDNVNRWRRQLGLAPIDADAYAALPRKPLLGVLATLVEIEGTYTPMGGGEPLPDALLLGLLYESDQEMVFFKLVGPKASVAAQREAFLSLAASFRQEMGSADAAHAAAGVVTPPPAARGRLAWDTPEGWAHDGRPPGVREVTMKVEGTNVSCWVMFLGGSGGGIEANVNRWRREVKQPPIDAGAVAKLPRLDVLDTQGVLVEAHGDYQGMGKESVKDGGLLGLIVPLAGRTLFVKMVGAAEAVAAQRANFEKFCTSLRMEE